MLIVNCVVRVNPNIRKIKGRWGWEAQGCALYK